MINQKLYKLRLFALFLSVQGASKLQGSEAADNGERKYFVYSYANSFSPGGIKNTRKPLDSSQKLLKTHIFNSDNEAEHFRIGVNRSQLEVSKKAYETFAVKQRAAIKKSKEEELTTVKQFQRRQVSGAHEVPIVYVVITIAQQAIAQQAIAQQAIAQQAIAQLVTQKRAEIERVLVRQLVEERIRIQGQAAAQHVVATEHVVIQQVDPFDYNEWRKSVKQCFAQRDVVSCPSVIDGILQQRGDIIWNHQKDREVNANYAQQLLKFGL